MELVVTLQEKEIMMFRRYTLLCCMIFCMTFFMGCGEKEELTVTDEDLEAEYAKMAEMYNQPVESIKEIFAMRGQVGMIKRNLLLEKVSDFLLENAKIG